jgi:maltose alpha-D-glucosyltransferase / alpha-amylase
LAADVSIHPDAQTSPPQSAPTSTPAVARIADAVARLPEAPNYREELRALLAALGGETNAWSARLHGVTTEKDALRLVELAAVISPGRAEELAVRFYERVLESLAAQSPKVRAFFDGLADDWYAESPLYYTYPHSLGVTDGERQGTLEDLRQQLPYLRQMGFRNMQLLPHWKSPGGDGGYDISGFVVDPRLGGEEAFRTLMDDAMGLGIRLITDFIPNHISVQHPWFQALLGGDLSKLDWFLAMDDHTFVGTETDAKGKLRVLLQNKDGVVSKPWAIFPHASKRNLIEFEVAGQKHQVFHSFYPFQVDLNLRNPDVLSELFKVLGWEASLGVAGKRMDAAPHWFKEEGTNYENLRGTHALQELFKLFYRHIVHRGITVPEVGEGLIEASQYFGPRVEIRGQEANAAGDAMFGFEWNATMWAMLLSGEAAPFWEYTRTLAVIHPHTFWFNLGRHHDELRTDLMPDRLRPLAEKILCERGAQMFAGRGVGGRMANFLEHDPRQIAKAFWLNFMPAKGTPVVYYGDEIGAVNQPEYMAVEQQRRLPILKELGFPTHDESVALDTRDIGRGGVSASAIARAVDSNYLPLTTLRALNALWSERPSLRNGDVHPVESGNAGVLSLVKWAKGSDSPLWGLCNLGSTEVTVTFSATLLRETLHAGAAGAFVLEDVLALRRGVSARMFELNDGTEDVTVTLLAHEHLLFSSR